MSQLSFELECVFCRGTEVPIIDLRGDHILHVGGAKLLGKEIRDEFKNKEPTLKFETVC